MPIMLDRLLALARARLVFVVAPLLLLLPDALAGPAAGAPPVRYTVSLAAPQTQTVEITARFADVQRPALDVMLPIWRPGLYRVLHPAATLRNVRATDSSGAALPVVKTGTSTWRVETGGARVVDFRYTIYANSIGDRTRHVDDTHAFLSGSAVFVYEPGRRGRAVEVRIEAPAAWRVATGLEADPEDPFRLHAPDYDVLVDSPLEIGLHDRLTFDVRDVPHEIVIWPPDVDYDGDRLVADFTRIVEAQAAIFGRLPYARYVFLVHVGAGGGGTEHLNSTIMQTRRASLEGSRAPDRAYRGFLGLVSHEFFHTWNVKQLRPADLQPYDYQRENFTRLLWVAEGTTSYYDDLTLVRTGLVTPERYFEMLARTIGTYRDRPGSSVQSLEEASFDAWIQFRNAGPDGVNSTISFYRKGALVSMMLDLHLRSTTSGRMSLDDVMRAMYERFPLGRGGYTTADLRAIAEELAGSDLEEFFSHFVASTMPLPLEDALEAVGLELYRAGADDDDDHRAGDDDATAGEDVDAYLGLDLADDAGRTRVRAVRSDGPAFAAGVIVDDEILSMDGRRLRARDLAGRLERMEPGQTVVLHLFRRDELRDVEITLGARAGGSWRVRRAKDASAEAREAYEAWLEQPWPGDGKGEAVAEDPPVAGAGVVDPAHRDRIRAAGKGVIDDASDRAP